MNRIRQVYSSEDITIEFSIVGNGTPILVFHGGHSNCNEEFGYESLAKHFMIITPSRAGYGKTSKEIGDHLSTACRHYVKLLNHLEIDKVHLLAMSAGGPTAIFFAATYPDRVQTLTLQSAVTKEWLTPTEPTYKVASVLFSPPIEKLTWMLVSVWSNLFPRFTFKKMAPSFSTLPAAEINARTNHADIEAIRKMNNRQQSGHGFITDMSQTDLSTNVLSGITCPTFIMHSKYDGSVSIKHAHHAHKNIPTSQLHMLDSWGHLIWLSETSDEVDQALISFIKTYNEASSN